MIQLTQEYLKSILRYDPDTGEWTWLIRKKGISNVHAGTRNSLGYKVIKINQKIYRGSRLAWLFMTGEWPSGTIDHKDRDPTNDRWINLADVSKSDQSRNRTLKKKKTSLPRWVTKTHESKNFSANVRDKNGKIKYLGSYKCPTKAYFAALAFVQQEFDTFHKERNLI